MTAAGWYNDERDSTRARWFDGASWTEHTLVKADWPGPGLPPPPEAPTLVQPVEWGPLPANSLTVTDRVKALPLWARIAVPSVVGLLLLGAVTNTGDEDVRTEDDTPSASSASDAAAIATEAISFSIPVENMEGLIRAICADEVSRAAGRVGRASADEDERRELVQAAGDAAATVCPDEVDRDPGRLNKVLAAATTTSTTATTPTSAPDVPTTLAAPVTTPTPPTTVRPNPVPSPPTTTRATTPTTSAPVVTQPLAPPTTRPPAPSSPYPPAPPYNGVDLDCGDIGHRVYVPPGNDPHGLDADNDTIGCESY